MRQKAVDLKASDQPLYNIGMVARMTGISIATLRAWERRYGFPRAGRTEGGHRLYSESDVARLRWVKGQIDQGMQTAQAIRALEYREFAAQEAAPSTAAEPPLKPVHAELAASVRDQILQALLHHDLDRADQVLADALPVLRPEGIILDVIGPTLTAIGDAWLAKEISVATEHLATHHLRQHLLMWMIGGPPPLPVRPIVLACAPGELHEGGLLMAGALLCRRRWPVAYLGQSVPLPDLGDLVQQIGPSLIVLVATGEEAATALAEWPTWMPAVARTGHPVVAFAGRIFAEQPAWRLRVPGTYLGDTLQDGIETIERLLRSTSI